MIWAVEFGTWVWEIKGNPVWGLMLRVFVAELIG